MKFLFISLFLILIIAPFSSQGDETRSEGEFSMLKTPDGVIIIFNSGVNSFKLEIPCKDIKEIDSQDMLFIIDKKVFQLTPVPITVFYADEKLITDEDLLDRHMQFEEDYAQSVNGKLKFNEKKFELPSGKICRYWDYRMPREKKDTSSNAVRKQFFVNTRLNSMVLMVSSVATLKDNDRKITEFLKKSLDGLTISPVNYNVQALSDSLKSLKKD